MIVIVCGPGDDELLASLIDALSIRADELCAIVWTGEFGAFDVGAESIDPSDRVRRARHGDVLEPGTVWLIPPAGMLIRDKHRWQLRSDPHGTGGDWPTVVLEIVLHAKGSVIFLDAAWEQLRGEASELDDGESGAYALLRQSRDLSSDGVRLASTSAEEIARTIRGEPAPPAGRSARPARDQPAVSGVDPTLPALSTNELTAILAMLKRKSGVDFSGYKRGTVKRRVSRRLSSLGMDRSDAYLKKLQGDEAEAAELRDDLLVSVTEFFRDEAAFAAIRQYVLPALVRQAEAVGQVRMWVAGCSTGEEVYSLAILIDEAITNAGVDAELSLFATDINRRALERASEGIYPASSVHQLSPESIEQYFTMRGESVIVRPELRQKIVFAAHDLLRNPPLSKIDLVSCRNVLIYFEPRAQERAIAALHFALRVNGQLFVGHSETLGPLETEFELVDAHARIYRKRRDVRLAGLRASTAGLTAITRATPPGETLAQRSGQKLIARKAYEVLLNRYVPPSLLVGPGGELLHTFGEASAYLKPPTGPMSDDLAKMLEPDLRSALRVGLNRVKTERTAVALEAIPHRGKLLRVTLEPIIFGDEICATVSFESTRRAPEGSDGKATLPAVSVATDRTADERVRTLEDELDRTRAELAGAVEQLDAVNEDLSAANEELVAANEELQSTNEEFQSMNEELRSVNADYQGKVKELTMATRDLDSLLRAVDVGAVFLDRHLAIRRFNSAAAALLRLLPHDIGRPLEHLAPAVRLEQGTIVDFTKAALEGESVDEMMARGPGDQAVLVRASQYFGEGSRADGVVVTLIDITELVEAQKLTLRARSQMDLFMEHASAGFWAYDPHAGELFLSAGFLRIFGMPRAELESGGATWWRPLVIEDDLEEVERAAQRLESGERMDIECRVKTASNDRRWVRIVGQRIAGKAGSESLSMGTCEDVTERVRADAILRGAMEAAPDAILVAGGDGAILRANESAETLFGYPREELETMNVDALVPNSGRAGHARLSEGFSREGRFPGLAGGRTLSALRKDGEQVPVEMALGFVDSVDPPVVCVLIRDVRERHAAEKRAEAQREASMASQRLEAVGRVAGGVAHDFNNALAVIQTYAECLRDDLEASSALREDAEQILSAAKGATNLTKQLLQVARRQPIEPQPVDVTREMQAIYRLLQRAAGEGVEIVSIGTDESCFVMLGEGQLEQVLLNLVVNSCDAMPDGGTIEVRTDVFDVQGVRNVCISVKDTGVGMTPEAAARAFEPFFSTKGERGTGLGLATCHGVITQAGGTMDIQSEPGKGTTIRILLPLTHVRLVESTSLSPAQREESSRPAKGRCVWLVEDQPALLEVASRAFSREGSRVVEAHSAEEALAMAESDGRLPDVLVTDIMLPGLSGVELAKRFRARWPTLPIVYCSGFVGDELTTVTRQDALTRFVPKPYLARDLVRAVRELLASTDGTLDGERVT